VIESKTLVTVVRHGETMWNREGKHQGWLDSDLTQHGISQAKRVADILMNRSFSTLYSSDLGRAWQTAKLLADKLSLNVNLDKRLREQNLGILEGLSIHQFKEIYPEEYTKHLIRKADYYLPGGESIRQVYERSTSCLEELVRKHQNESILIVTHGWILECFLRKVLEIPLEQPRRFSLKNCSINSFSFVNENWRLESWGEIYY
jgi:broad specificity phosphatase PhoE